MPRLICYPGAGGRQIVVLGENTAEAARQAIRSEAGASLSQAWAEGTLPGGAGTKSAREHAIDAGNSLASIRYNITTASQLPLIDAEGGLWWLSVDLDATGRIVRGQKSDGSFWSAAGAASPAQILSGAVNSAATLSTSLGHLPLIDAGAGLWWRLIVLDATGRIIWGQKSDGSIWEATGGAAVTPVSGAGAGAVPSYATDTNYSGPAHPVNGSVYGTLTVAETNTGFIDMFVWLGQSYDHGGNGAAYDAPFSPTALDPGKVLMLNQGTYPNGAVSTSFIDARAQAQSGAIQAPGPLAGRMVQAAFTAAGVTGPKTLVVTAAKDGTSIYGIKKGTTPYAQLLTYVSQAQAIASANGQTLRVRALLTRHGEQDSSAVERGAFAAAWLALRRDFDADVKAITGQKVPVLLLTWQNSDNLSTAPATDTMTTLAQLDMIDMEPSLAQLTLPGYWVGPQDGQGGANAGSHYMAMGWAQMDEAEGLAIVNHVYGPGYRPLRTLKGRSGAWWSSATAIELAYTQPVLLDTTNNIVDVSQLAAKGFEFSDGTGSPPSISSVTQVAASQSISIAANAITFGHGNDPAEAIVLVYSGSTYSLLVNHTLTAAQIAAGFAAKIAGATASGAVLTLPGAPTSCIAYSGRLTITLASAPTGTNKVLRYALRGTGTGKPGNQTTARGAVRSPLTRALSLVAAGKATFSSNPSTGDTITCNGVVITFVASGATGNQVNIGGSASVTVGNLYTFLSGQTANSSLNVGRYGISADGLALLFYSAVTTSYTLARSSGAITLTALSAIPHYEWAAVERIDL